VRLEQINESPSQAAPRVRLDTVAGETIPAEAERTALAEELRLLRDDELAEWDGLVDLSPQGSVFCRSWWLQACGGDIRVLGYFKGGKLIAGIPLFYQKRFQLRFCLMPKLTQVWGVVIEPLSGKLCNVHSRENEILAVFAKRLAGEFAFYQRFHPSQSNWLPFLWNGFQQTTGYSYFLDKLDHLDGIWAEMGQNTRTKIRKAEKSGLVVKPCSPATVMNTVEKIFRRQSLPVPFDLQTLSRLNDAAVERDAGGCWAAVDAEGNAHASTFLVFDQKRAYNLAGGPDPDFRSDGAQAFLTWNSIQRVAGRTEVFDFAGSMLEQVESSIRAFGAKQAPYNLVSHFPFVLRLGLHLLDKL